MATEQKLHLETLALHVGQETADPASDARAVPIYQTTSYVFRNSQHAADRFALRDAGNIYGRLTNSTQDVFERRVAALEGGVAGLAVASGAAAVTYALQNVLQNGDHIVAADNLYGGSFNLITHTLTTQGVDYTIVNVNDLEALEAAIRPNTKVVYAETFGNPNSDVTNLDAIAEVAHRHNVLFIVDTYRAWRDLRQLRSQWRRLRPRELHQCAHRGLLVQHGRRLHCHQERSQQRWSQWQGYPKRLRSQL